MGKGSKRRPQAISEAEMAENWDRIFNRNCNKVLTNASERRPNNIRQ